MKYNAFISYSHASDDALAPALQSALHAFARPWTRMRALHVFRDQTSLAASPELWPAIESALKESTHLLLLASPAAAGSRWVAREIEWWLANRSSSTMLVLLTEGDLAWDDAAVDFDWRRTTSLPRDVITGRLHGEPLWVDLRWARTSDTLTLRNARFRSAVLDIAAPLHGKDKDALDGEDVRAFARLQRVRRAAIAGLATLTIAAVVAATVAVRQRDEAVKQNAIAQAGRLAVQADLLRERGGATDVGVLLAAQALSVLESVHERSFEVDLSMRRALAGLPREVAQLTVYADALRLSPSGEFLVAELSGEVSVLRLPSGEKRSCDRAEAISKSTPSTALGFVTAASTNGDFCIMQHSDPGNRTTLALWSARPLKRVDEWKVTTKAGSFTPAISDNGDLLATTDRTQSGEVAQSTLRVWSRSRRTELLRIDGEEFRGFSPDYRHFATTLGLWSLPDSGSRVVTRVFQWSGEPWRLAFSRSGLYVVTRASSDGPAQLWDVGARRLLRSFKPPDGEILALRDDGRFIVVESERSTVLVDTENGDVHERIPVEMKAAAFAAYDPTLLAHESTSFRLPRVRVLSMASSGSALAMTELPAGASVEYIALRRDHVDALVATVSVLRLMRWSFQSGQWTTALTLASPSAMNVSPDGAYFAAVVGDSVVVARTDGAGKAMALPTTDPATVIGLSAGGDYLATNSGKGNLTVLDVRNAGKRLAKLASEPAALMVSRDGAYLVALMIDTSTPSRTGLRHTLVRIGIATPGDKVTIDLGRYLKPLTSLCMVSDDAMFVRAGRVRHPFVADSSSLSIGADDLTECAPSSSSPVQTTVDSSRLLVSDRATGKPLARLDHAAPVVRVSVSDDGQRVVTLDDRQTLHLFALDARSLITLACSRKPRPLTDDEWARYLGAATLRDACGRDRATSAATERFSPQP